MQELMLLYACLACCLISLILIVIIAKNISSKGALLQLRSIEELIKGNTERSEKALREEFARSRQETYSNSSQVRGELNILFKTFEDSFFKRMLDLSNLQKSQLDIFSDNLSHLSKSLEDRIEGFRCNMESKFSGFQASQDIAFQQVRKELSDSLKNASDLMQTQLTGLFQLQKEELSHFSSQIALLTQSNEQKLDQLKDKVEEKLKNLEELNSGKLDEMRLVVDEKLHATLEKRLGESFRLVSERLELVHKGLGEMQTLASGVGDLKRVLTNIKTRGTWGEIQLGSLIEQVLSPGQFEKNVATKKNSACIVEYAIKMPGRGNNGEDVLWMPIDAKFPLEDYQRLCDAQESANALLVEETSKALENRIKTEARDIFEKYIDPPQTTDFAILFLPVEGLYAEVLRRPGLYDRIQRDYRVILAGPTTLTAILNSLQMGFRTLAIEKRSSEVWSLLGGVKTEFGNFGAILDKTKKKLQEASNTIDSASVASRRIERKLKDVQAFPAQGNETMLLEGEEEI
ncbi:MAG: DNA recombination protein RmuC [Ignavibacteriales bacterium]